MAGGMNKRGSYGPWPSGSAAAPELPSPPSRRPRTRRRPVKHCWVTDRHGRLPGLLLEWQRRGDAWHGRVVRPVPSDDGWIVVEEWIPAELLDPA